MQKTFGRIDDKIVRSSYNVFSVKLVKQAVNRVNLLLDLTVDKRGFAEMPLCLVCCSRSKAQYFYPQNAAVCMRCATDLRKIKTFLKARLGTMTPPEQTKNRRILISEDNGVKRRIEETIRTTQIKEGELDDARPYIDKRKELLNDLIEKLHFVDHSEAITYKARLNRKLGL